MLALILLLALLAVLFWPSAGPAPPTGAGLLVWDIPDVATTRTRIAASEVAGACRAPSATAGSATADTNRAPRTPASKA